MDLQIRAATRDDAPAISRVIIAALRESNAQDYSQEIIDLVEQSFCAAA
ncbi:MAG: GNAT family N-acetyltransferase, partial [Pseudomonas sp.]